MAQTNRIEKVAIVVVSHSHSCLHTSSHHCQASGRKHFPEELLKTGKHTVTALIRADSIAILPTGVKIA